MASDTNTYETAHMLANLSSAIPVDDPERIDRAMEAVATQIDTDWLQDHLKVQRQRRLSPRPSATSCPNAQERPTSESFCRKATSPGPCRLP